MINSVTYHLLYVCHFLITSMRTSVVAITPRLKIILTNQLYKINSQFKNSVIFVTVVDKSFLLTHHGVLGSCFCLI
ncbi:hypothetical protein FV119_12980 [Staphylococcus aureus]|nr:hypothetical protein FV119_12980 [Staphylococcus aureus]